VPTPDTILLVDDEVSVRGPLCAALRDCGYSVLDAANYDDALRICRQHQGEIALLITDISLPGNNGYELAAWISSIHSKIKVIFVSGQAGAEFCKFYNGEGTDPRLLKKPFDADELIRRAQSALGSGGLKMSRANGG
jgi:two-component system cell cycle sensor histidine kinase/response regulator CckA